MPFRGVVGPVLHHLLGRDVERHAHSARSLLAAAEQRLGRASATSSSSSIGVEAVGVEITATVGKMPPHEVGAAGGGVLVGGGEQRPEREVDGVVARSMPSRHAALIQLRACTPPEPLVWKSASSYLPPVAS